MHLVHLTTRDVEEIDRDTIVLIPSGSLEQHGSHLPLSTDSLIGTAIAEAVEARMAKRILLVPTLWLGASGHHLAFAGTLSSDFASYMGAIESVVESLVQHRFHRFFVLNSHGGNTSPNDVILRSLKQKYSYLTLATKGYDSYAAEEIRSALTGPIKEIWHACEAETSLMMHLHPELVRLDMLRDDGLTPEPNVISLVSTFDEITESGSFGYATQATAEKGKIIFDAAVEGLTSELEAISNGVVFLGDAR